MIERSPLIGSKAICDYFGTAPAEGKASVLSRSLMTLPRTGEPVRQDQYGGPFLRPASAGRGLVAGQPPVSPFVVCELAEDAPSIGQRPPHSATSALQRASKLSRRSAGPVIQIHGADCTPAPERPLLQPTAGQACKTTVVPTIRTLAPRRKRVAADLRRADPMAILSALDEDFA
jgi:hypothetical protein